MTRQTAIPFTSAAQGNEAYRNERFNLYQESNGVTLSAQCDNNDIVIDIYDRQSPNGPALNRIKFSALPAHARNLAAQNIIPDVSWLCAEMVCEKISEENEQTGHPADHNHNAGNILQEIRTIMLETLEPLRWQSNPLVTGLIPDDTEIPEIVARMSPEEQQSTLDEYKKQMTDKEKLVSLPETLKQERKEFQEDTSIDYNDLWL
jgi:hypothetical protein